MKTIALISAAALISLAVFLLVREPVIARWFPERGYRINARRDRKFLERTLREMRADYGHGKTWTRQSFIEYVSRRLPRQIEKPWPHGLTPDERDTYAYHDQARDAGRVKWLVSRGWEHNPRNPFLHPPVDPICGHRI